MTTGRINQGTRAVCSVVRGRRHECRRRDRALPAPRAGRGDGARGAPPASERRKRRGRRVNGDRPRPRARACMMLVRPAVDGRRRVRRRSRGTRRRGKRARTGRYTANERASERTGWRAGARPAGGRSGRRRAPSTVRTTADGNALATSVPPTGRGPLRGSPSSSSSSSSPSRSRCARPPRAPRPRDAIAERGAGLARRRALGRRTCADAQPPARS